MEDGEQQLGHSFHLLVPKSSPATKKCYRVWNFIFLLLEATVAFPHAVFLCHISDKGQHKGDTSRVPPSLCVFNSCDSHIAPNPKISEYLVLYWSPDNPGALWYVPLCPPELLFQQCLGSSSVPNFKFSSINSGTITSETVKSVIVMVTSSWDTDIAVLCKFTITCISFVHLPSYWTKLKKIAAQEEAPNPVDS